MAKRNEWELLEWRELEPGILWHKRGDSLVRYMAEHAKGVSSLRRLTGIGETFRSELVSDLEEPYFSRGSLAGFEHTILRIERESKGGTDVVETAHFWEE